MKNREYEGKTMLNFFTKEANTIEEPNNEMYKELWLKIRQQLTSKLNVWMTAPTTLDKNEKRRRSRKEQQREKCKGRNKRRCSRLESNLSQLEFWIIVMLESVRIKLQTLLIGIN